MNVKSLPSGFPSTPSVPSGSFCRKVTHSFPTETFTLDRSGMMPFNALLTTDRRSFTVAPGPTDANCETITSVR